MDGVSIEGGSTEGVYTRPPSTELEAIRALLALYTHGEDGEDEGPTWHLDERLASLLRVPLPVLEERRPTLEAAASRVDQSEWATALVIAMLQLRFHDHASCWGAVIEARHRGMPRELMRRAMEAICELVTTLF